ncbi:hypothetical protein chiPu_0019560 [Chiloscyllium punctatum]|uniref:Amino acid transporter transmembrane domain-containing protein n=1 Tax=Chiloscyllium punctatum TaxID=137246 RepID=A0A401RSG6_CHIPU|nr:hypothetical protein [Chiloscyllium punctatum]
MDNLESKGGNNSSSSELKDFTHSQDGLQRKCDNDDLECTMYHANSDDGRKENKENHAGSTSMYMSAFNLSNAIIGTGLLGLSYAMANTGIIPFVIIALELLMGSMVYETLGQHAFGRPGKLAVFGSTSLQNIGAILSYLFVVKKELPEVIQSFTGQDSSEAWYLIDRNLVILVTLIIILPLCLFRNIGYLGYTSGFSLACMIFFLIVVIYKQTQFSCDTSLSVNITDLVCTITCTPEYFVWNDKTVYALPTMAFAFVCHPSVLPIYRELKDHTCKKMQVVSTISFFSMFAIYLLTAVFGYLTFYNTVNEELLLSYHDHRDKLILILRLAVITAVVLTVPVLLFTVRSSIVLLVLKGKFTWLHHFIITFFLLTGSNLLVIYIPSIMDVFAVIGSTSANMLIFILPASLYLKLVKNEPQNSWQRKGAMAFLAVGIIFMFVTVPLIFVEWNKRSSNNTSTGSCSGQH